MNTTLAYWFNVKGSAIYLPNGHLPFGTAEQWQYQNKNYVQIETYKNHPVYLLLDIDENLDYQSLRSQLHRSEEEVYLFQRAVGLQHFFSHQRYCGRCAEPMKIADDVLAVHCSACNYINFPRISPCIIVGIRKGRQILLAHHARHQQPLYTVLAGFVEIGETLEQAVHREVFEESGLKVNNLRYLGSQAWSFPNSLMVGFIADYVAGEIKIQPEEIADAKWVDIEQLADMPLPMQGTIARQIIEAMRQQIQNEQDIGE